MTHPTTETAALPVGFALVSMSGVSKRFGGVVAIRHADLELHRGEVHALIGENGAGKSTLVNILAGILRPDSGTILVNDQEVSISSPRAARVLGISVVHQHPVLFPDLTVAENIMFAYAPPRRGPRILDWKAVQDNAVRALSRLDVRLDTKALVSTLSSADQQLLEIVKALYHQTDLLILDEPTAALSRREVDRLMEIIRRLKSDGVAILFVGHRLNEVFELADRVTVSRDGATVVTGPVGDFTPDSAVRHMVGRTVDNIFPKSEITPGEVFLEVKGLSRSGSYNEVNFQVRKGEILGLAGLVGAGRTEIARGIFGLDPVDAGSILIDGKPVRISSPQEAMEHGIAYVPEDRHNGGVILEHSIKFNLPLAVLGGISRLGLISVKKDRDISRYFIDRLRIRTSGPAQQVSALSGGNQQKVVLGKWLATEPAILILDDPTKGIDVGAKAEVHQIVSAMAQRGLTIILISNELEELLAVADRIVTFYRGDQGREFSQRPFDAEAVLGSMTGQVPSVSA